MKKARGMFVWILRATALFTLFLGLTNACLCTIKSLSLIYCEADFVIKACIIRPPYYNYHDSGYPGFQVDIKNYFQVSQLARQIIEREGLKPTSDPSCQINLEYDVCYLIAGKIKSGHAVVDRCSYVSKWGAEEERIKPLLEGYLKKHCKCFIVPAPKYPTTSTTTTTTTTTRPPTPTPPRPPPKPDFYTHNYPFKKVML